ncbi:unnamed protein product [Rotaria magnacalcarata]|uniref:Uncharacterized protein n=5 Tax=Rotaria magnacalcarata TaxID=392030 RepID=A0A819LI59_9BILA|nr:unnamed protein product [Rotaria magnacalcarata]CAF1519244.1 unnamed protein product [Rotaria magnacalcarata]CAF2025211.1 unnamed protein product [Rotaria magnacalcarata]CAF2161422.1 unnamed protein product [Rotaria magnacalcarata]CAF3961377.1 unnamed protein product [Rotaria magnacalcarata]
MQAMTTVTVLLLTLWSSHFTTGQIPNPDQYRFTWTSDGVAQERYAIDKKAGKMSRLWFSNTGDEEFGGNQDIYVRDDSRTYLFNFMAQPPQCIANRGGPYNEMNFWPNLVQSFGGEQKKYDELLFDPDCDGTCLTWKTEYNETYHHYRYVNRLYVKKAEKKPIKIVLKTYDLNTGSLVSTSVTRFINWVTGNVPDYEYDYPMDLETCFKP